MSLGDTPLPSEQSGFEYLLHRHWVHDFVACPAMALTLFLSVHYSIAVSEL